MRKKKESENKEEKKSSSSDYVLWIDLLHPAYACENQSYPPHFEAAFKVLKPFKARFHWGKCWVAPPCDVIPLYPKFSEFVALRNKLDPEKKFLNQSMLAWFGETPDKKLQTPPRRLGCCSLLRATTEACQLYYCSCCCESCFGKCFPLRQFDGTNDPKLLL